MDNTKKKKPLTLQASLHSLLRQEIKWHREHPGISACGSKFESGFISGLIQAQRLICRALRAVQSA